MVSLVTNVRTGLESFLEQPFRYVRGRAGLVTNHSAVTYDLTHIVDAMLAVGVQIEVLFSPEHGIRGELPAGNQVPFSVDPISGLSIHSLYGENKQPTQDQLENIDVLIFDIQDVGVRFYTYVQTMVLAMRSAAENGKEFIVLDRPNPISGLIVEGPILNEAFSSFVGAYPIPIRYGLTIGELAHYLNLEQGINAQLTVVKLDGWQRDMWYEETQHVWVPPSPAMPTVDTASVYPGFCLFEGTNISEGRGTTKPFEIIGAPWLDGNKLAQELNAVGLVGVRFRPVRFVPTRSKYQGELCEGIQLHPMDRQIFRPFTAAITAIDIIHQLWPDQFEFTPPKGDNNYFFDLLAGTDKVRLDILSGRPAPAIVGDLQHKLCDFLDVRARYLLY